MADRSYDILINIDARVQAIQEAVTQTQRLVQEASGLEKAFGLAGVIELTHRLAEALTEIPNAIFEGIKAGVEFNSEIQDLQTNIAGVLRLTQGDKFGSFAEAKTAAGEYVEIIKAAANTVGVSYETMFETVHETQAQLSSAGITDIHQTIQAALLLTQAMQAVGVGAQNASRDVGDLLQGNLQTQGGRRLASALGLTTEELQKMVQGALQSGTVIDLLTTKFAPLQDAIRDASQNFGADVNRMKNFLVDLESEAAKPIMEPLRQGIAGVADSHQAEQLLIIAHTIGEISSAAIAAAAQVTRLAEVIDKVGRSYSALTTVLRTISQITPTGLAFHDFIAGAYDKSKQAVEAEVAATKASAAAHAAAGNAAQTASAKIVSLTQKQRDELAKTNAAAQLLEDTLGGNAVTIATDRATEATRALRAEWEKQGPITAEQETAIKRIYDATYKTVLAQQEHKQAAAGARAEAEGERDARRQITDLLQQDSALLHSLQSQQRLIDQNPFLGADEKQALTHDNAIQQQAEVEAATKRTQAALDDAYGSGTQQEVTQLEQRLDELKTRSVELGYTISTTNFTGGLRKELTEWVNSFGSASHAVAGIITGTLNTAIGSASQAITGLIFRTGDWRQTFASAAESIVQNIIQIVLQYTIGAAIMSVVRAAFGEKDDQASTQKAAAAAAKWAPAAIAASIASYGSAAYTGLAAFAIAEAAGIAIAAGGSALGGAGGSYAAGGYTGDVAANVIAGVVHGGEYVLSAAAVDNLGGPTVLDEFHASALNNLSFHAPVAGYAAGGFVDRGGLTRSGAGSLGGFNGKRDITIIQVRDEKEAMKEYLKSGSADTHIIKIVSGRGTTVHR